MAEAPAAGDQGQRGPAPLGVVCLAGSILIIAFLSAVAAIDDAPLSLKRVLIIGVVCAAFCFRAWQARRELPRSTSAGDDPCPACDDTGLMTHPNSVNDFSAPADVPCLCRKGVMLQRMAL